jgi:hypothetical protein
MSEHKAGLAATAGARVIKAADIADQDGKPAEDIPPGQDSEQQAENLQAGDTNGR